MKSILLICHSILVTFLSKLETTSSFIPPTPYLKINNYIFKQILFDKQKVDVVERLIARLGFEKDKVFDIVSQDENVSAVNDLSCSLGKNKCTLDIALSHYYSMFEN